MTPIEAKRDQIRRQLQAAGVTITESINAVHLHKGQRSIRVSDITYLDTSDYRALGVLPNMTPGRWRVG